MTLHTDLSTRPRRRRPPQRGLLFGASLDRLPHGTPPPEPGSVLPRSFEPVPIALIGESTPVAPARVAPFGSMAASWPLAEGPVDDRVEADLRALRLDPASDPSSAAEVGAAVGPGVGLGLGLGIGLHAGIRAGGERPSGRSGEPATC